MHLSGPNIDKAIPGQRVPVPPTAHHVSASANSFTSGTATTCKEGGRMDVRAVKVLCSAIENLDGHTSEAAMRCPSTTALIENKHQTTNLIMQPGEAAEMPQSKLPLESD
jgi:hypothetical protein